MSKDSVLNRIPSPRKLLIIAFGVIVIKLPLLPSCTPAYDFWKKSQQYMYLAQGMYTIDSLTNDTLVIIEGGVK